MTLTNAERQRRFREKRDNDPQRRAEYLQKKNEKYKQDIEVGKRYLIDQMSDRSKRAQRKLWRKQQKQYRERRKKKPSHCL